MKENNFVEKSVAQLKQAGFRITRPRLFVLEFLAQSTRPLNAQKIHENLLANEKSLDLVSVYRILDVLLEQGLIHRDAETGSYFSCLHCEHCPEDTHIFLKCLDCSNVRELDYHGEVFSDSFKRKLSKLQNKPTKELIYLNDICASCG